MAMMEVLRDQGWLESLCTPESHVGTSQTNQESVHWGGAGSPSIRPQAGQNSTQTRTPLSESFVHIAGCFWQGTFPKGDNSFREQKHGQALNMDSKLLSNLHSCQRTRIPESRTPSS